MTEAASETLKLSDILTIIAIILGPILALWIQRWLDKLRAQKSRQLHVFRTLMSTRATTVAPAHVEALNLILIEFHPPEHWITKAFGAVSGSTKLYEQVIEDWQTYLDHLNYGPGDPSAPGFDQNRATVWGEKTPEHLSKLLQSMGKALGYHFSDVEVRRGGYRPKAHDDVQNQDAINRRCANELWLGKRSIPISIVHVPDAQSGPELP